MTPDRLQSAAPLIAVALLVLALVLFLLSLRYFRKSRTDFYWRRRRSAGQRGWRLFVWSLFLTLSSGIICLGTGVQGLLQARSVSATAAAIKLTLSPTDIRVTVITNTPTQTDTATLTETQTEPATAQEPASTSIAMATATATSSPTSTSTGSPSPSPVPTQDATDVATAAPTASPTPGPASTTILLRTATHTATPTMTYTPSLTLTPTETLVPAIANTTVLESSVTPSAQATLTITALDTQISAQFGPVTPGDTFPAGFNRIYYFVKFSGMQSGVLWRRQLLQDGKVLEDSNYLWGRSAQEGTTYFFFGQEDGFKAGQYEVRLYLGQGSKPITAAAFTVK